MNLQTILSHPKKRKYLKICLLKKIIGEIKNFLETLALAEREIFCEETRG
jgi:hypothetical protein